MPASSDSTSPGPTSPDPPEGRLVETPHGPARLLEDEAEHPYATLVLGHGAGGGSQARDLAALAAGLPARGISVVRVDQPWRVAGKRVAAAPAVLDRGWLAALAALHRGGNAGPLVVGGRSAGARVACRTAGTLGAAGVVALAFPLHPPGRPERSRAAELLGAGVATLVVQGERDTFGGPDELPVGPYELHVVPGADHGLRVAGGSGTTQSVALRDVVDRVERFVRERV